MKYLKLEAEFIDNSFVNLKIPFKDIGLIVEDIEQLFKNKDKSGKYNIGAHGISIELVVVLKDILRKEAQKK